MPQLSAVRSKSNAGSEFDLRAGIYYARLELTLTVVYSIPFYKLLDTEESRIAKPMYPCETEPALIEKMNATKSLNLWIESMKKLGEMKLYIQRYQQIVQVPVDNNCLCSITAYTELLINQINALWNDFISVEDIVNELIEDADEQNSELLNVVQLFFDCYEEIETVISNKNDPSELIQIIETVSVIMFVLLPFVSEYSSNYDCA